MTLDEFNKGYIDHVMSANPATVRHSDIIGRNLLSKDVLHGSSDADVPNVEVKQLFWSSPYGSCLASNNNLGYFSRLAALCVWSFSAHLLAEKSSNLRLVTDNDGARLAMALRLPYRYVDGSLQSLTSGSQNTRFTEAYARLMDASVTRHTSPKTMYVGRDVLLFRFPGPSFYEGPCAVTSQIGFINESWKIDVFRACVAAVNEVMSRKVTFTTFNILDLLDWEDANSSMLCLSNDFNFRTLLNNASREILSATLNAGLSPETVSILSDRYALAVAKKAKLPCNNWIPSLLYSFPSHVGKFGYVEVNLKRKNDWLVNLLGRFQARYPEAYDRCLAVEGADL